MAQSCRCDPATKPIVMAMVPVSVVALQFVMDTLANGLVSKEQPITVRLAIIRSATLLLATIATVAPA